MAIPELGVCSWSLQAKSVPELKELMDSVGAAVAQVALGDPNHASWDEGDGFISKLRASRIPVSATMIGYPGEDYTSPATIKATGGFGNAETREACLKIFRDAVDRTAELEVSNLMSHAGFIPDTDDPARGEFLDCLYDAAEYAGEKGVTFSMETGQESAELLRRTLDELSLDNLRVNFDPANMLLYNMGDPLHAIEVLGPDIESVHVKDAVPPTVDGEWGEEVPLGKGQVGMREFLAALSNVGYDGPLVVEREVGTQEQRIQDIRAGIDLLRKLISVR